MSPATFAATLNARGIELTLKGRRLHVWPGRAYRHGLSDAERDYLREHRAELKALVEGGLPETTVQWQDPTRAPRDAQPDAPNAPSADPAAAARLAASERMRRENPAAFAVLYPDDPTSVAWQQDQSDAVMFAGLRRNALVQRASRSLRRFFGGY